MLEQQITIINKLGLHARAAAKLVKLSSSFDSHVEIEKEGMGVMMLAASRGSEVTIYVDGTDEEAANRAICELINDRFGEDE